MVHVFEHTKAMAATDLPVLIVGESGCGKAELAAQIHRNSRFQSGPLVVVNCASLDPLLAESTLFGHERGAFTGAVGRRLGLVEQACRGTLVLDDFQNIPLAVQAKLLRVLETGLIRRIGAQGEKHCEIRVVVCMNRDPGEEVAAGRLLKDLLFRIEAGAVVIPPVRERPEDIPALVESLIQNTKMLRGRSVTPAAIHWLQQLDLQGNVRELRTILLGAAIGGGDVLDVDDLKRGISPWHQRRIEGTGDAEADTSTEVPQAPVSRPRRALERHEVVKALEEHGFIQAETARRLGIPRQSFREMMERFGLMKAWNAARDLVRRGLLVPLGWARPEKDAGSAAVPVASDNVPRTVDTTPSTGRDAEAPAAVTGHGEPEPEVHTYEQGGVLHIDVPQNCSSDLLWKALTKAKMNQTTAAQALEVPRQTLRERMERYNLMDLWRRSQSKGQGRQADDTEVAAHGDQRPAAEATSAGATRSEGVTSENEGLMSALLTVYVALQLQLFDLRLSLDDGAAA